MNRLKISRLLAALVFVIWSCDQQDPGLNSQSIPQLTIDVAQASGQLASGASFAFSGSSTDSTQGPRPKGPKGQHGPGGHGFAKNPGILDGLNLLAPTDELLAIVDAESASDFRGLRVSKNGGASITNYNAAGNVIQAPLLLVNGPQGCSFSGKQFPKYDSLLKSIAKTVIDFGTGKTFRRDTIEIVRAGKIVITRSVSGSTTTETTTFENYTVNGIKIEGTKTRVSTFDEETGAGSSTTTVSGGKITLEDGTVAVWTSERSRVTDETTITTTVSSSITANGDVIYSHKTASPLIENLACEGKRKGPVSGVLETTYHDNDISINFGDGSCTNRTVTLTVNGTVTTRTIN